MHNYHVILYVISAKFSMKIIECVYEKGEENWMGVFHASAVNHNDNAILILGDSGNGKSTSLALLQAQGFHCVADDFVPIDTTTKIHAFPAGISIKKNSLPVLLNYYPELKNSAEYHYSRLNKTVRYLPPKNINYQKKHPCKAFVFIKYDSTTEFEITKIELPCIEFRIVCGKGTYIRSLAHDFGKSLNNGAHLSGLRRTKIGEFRVEDAISVLEFERLFKN